MQADTYSLCNISYCICIGVPSKIRLDPGTENGLTADIQTLLCLPDEKCVALGKSTANQVLIFKHIPVSKYLVTLKKVNDI